MRPSCRRFVTALPLLALLACSDRGARQEITVVRTYDPVPRWSFERWDDATRLGFRNPHARTPARPPLTWATPEGWTELPTSTLRIANFRPPGEDVECYLSPLTGGMTAENVNRWRGQMGLAPLSADEIAALPRHEMLGGEAVYVDLEGSFRGMGATEGRDGYRMVALLLDLGRSALSLKMIGPADDVAAALPAFHALRASLRRNTDEASQSPAGNATKTGTDGGVAQSARLRFEIPEGWVSGKAGGMREATLHPAGNPAAQCTLIILGGAAGGETDNIARWYGQMGKPTPSVAEISGLPRVRLLGAQAPLVELRGSFRDQAGTERDDQAMLATMAPIDGDTLFVKLTGPADLVLGEKARFIEFCASITRR